MVPNARKSMCTPQTHDKKLQFSVKMTLLKTNVCAVCPLPILGETTVYITSIGHIYVQVNNPSTLDRLESL